MFTGLIEDVGTLVSRQTFGDSGKLQVSTHLPLDEVRVGDSVAVNGACLTVETVLPASGCLVFHTLGETLRRTSLGDLAVGRALNLERALCLGDRLGGHLVSGHVDTTTEVREIVTRAADIVLTIALPEELRALVIPKGSIAIDGISLTIARLEATTLSVHIIPHTWEHTNLRTATRGGVVNLEADMLGKYVLRQHEVAAGPSVSMGVLRDAGFD